MAKLPKIIYNGKQASNVNYNGKDVLNVVMDGKTVFHKHKDNICRFYHPATETRCQGTINVCTWGVSPVDSQWVDVNWTCTNGHSGYAVDPNDGRNHNRYGSKCNKLLGTTPAYYSYSCGFSET